MKKLKSIEEINEGQNVILRIDADVPVVDEKIIDNSRLLKSVPTIRFLLEKKCKLIIVGHMGRPAFAGATSGKPNQFSLKIAYVELMEILEKNCNDCITNVFIEDIKDEKKILKAVADNQIVFVENLRFWAEEELGDTSLFDSLKKAKPVFVNDAFAVAHRKNASILLHNCFETYYGLNFVEEYDQIKRILENKEKPMTIVLGGAKIDKMKHLNELIKIADHILIGGKLPRLRPAGYDGQSKIIWAGLREDGLDLSDKDIEKFSEIINSSKIVIWAGAMGFYEDKNCQKGTEKIAESIANCQAFKIIAGGDTTASIINLGLKNKIDFICSGGGVMLEMLVNNNLPAWY